MNFLKISSLVIGTGSVVGGTGAGIYYATNNKKSKTEESANKVTAGEEAMVKAQFDGKLVFVKKADSNYEIEFLTEDEYSTKATAFDSNVSAGSEYANVNKVIEISLKLNIPDTKTKLNDIFQESLTLEAIKSKIQEKENEIKTLFNDDIYKKLKTKFELS